MDWPVSDTHRKRKPPGSDQPVVVDFLPTYVAEPEEVEPEEIMPQCKYVSSKAFGSHTAALEHQYCVELNLITFMVRLRLRTIPSRLYPGERRIQGWDVSPFGLLASPFNAGGTTEHLWHP